MENLTSFLITKDHCSHIQPFKTKMKIVMLMEQTGIHLLLGFQESGLGYIQCSRAEFSNTLSFSQTTLPTQQPSASYS